MAGERRKRLTVAEKQKILNLLQEGKPLAEVAKTAGVCVATVSKLKRKGGLARSRRSLSYEVIRERYLNAVREMEKWKAQLETAIKAQEKKLSEDRKALGLE